MSQATTPYLNLSNSRSSSPATAQSRSQSFFNDDYVMPVFEVKGIHHSTSSSTKTNTKEERNKNNVASSINSISLAGILKNDDILSDSDGILSDSSAPVNSSESSLSPSISINKVKSVSSDIKIQPFKSFNVPITRGQTTDKLNNNTETDGYIPQNIILGNNFKTEKNATTITTKFPDIYNTKYSINTSNEVVSNYSHHTASTSASASGSGTGVLGSTARTSGSGGSGSVGISASSNEFTISRRIPASEIVKPEFFLDYQIHTRISGWKLTSPERRDEIIQMFKKQSQSQSQPQTTTEQVNNGVDTGGRKSQVDLHTRKQSAWETSVKRLSKNRCTGMNKFPSAKTLVQNAANSVKPLQTPLGGTSANYRERVVTVSSMPPPAVDANSLFFPDREDVLKYAAKAAAMAPPEVVNPFRSHTHSDGHTRVTSTTAPTSSQVESQRPKKMSQPELFAQRSLDSYNTEGFGDPFLERLLAVSKEDFRRPPSSTSQDKGGDVRRTSSSISSGSTSQQPPLDDDDYDDEEVVEG